MRIFPLIGVQTLNCSKILRRFAVAAIIGTIGTIGAFSQAPAVAAPSCHSKCERNLKNCERKAIATFKERMSTKALSKELALSTYEPKFKAALKGCHGTFKKCTKPCVIVCDDCDGRYDRCAEKARTDAAWTTPGRRQAQIDKGVAVCETRRTACRRCEKK